MIRHHGMKRRLDWRVWMHDHNGSCWFAETGYAFGSEATALAAARRDWPNGRTIMGHTVGIGQIGGPIKCLSEYPS